MLNGQLFLKEKRMKEKTYEFFSSIQTSEVEWLWYPYIPYGKITILQGDPGEGKSTFILNIAARLTKGQDMPDGVKSSAAYPVIYQCAEDNPSDTIKPRLVAAGADCSKVAFIVDSDMNLTLDDSRIETTIREVGARLLIFDPLQSFMVQDGDMHSASRMRSILGRLAMIAEKYKCAVVLVGHMNKATGGKNLYRGLGSIDIAAIARSVLMIERDEDDSEIRYMYPIKSSLAKEGPGITFRLSYGGMEYIDTCRQNTNKIERNEGISKRDRCISNLAVLLKDGARKSADILELMLAEGISERTVNTVKKEIGITSFRKEGAWYWCLPDRGAKDG